MLLYIVRHGESVANLEGRLPEPATPLTDEGSVDADIVAAYLQGKGIEAIYANRLRRVAETARRISTATGAPVIFYEGLRDMDYGDHAGRSRDDSEVDEAIDKINDRIPGYRFPNGGNFYDLERRVAQALGRILNSGKETVAVVAHRDTNKLLIRRLLRMHQKETHWSLELDHTTVYQFDTRAGLLFCTEPVGLRAYKTR